MSQDNAVSELTKRLDAANRLLRRAYRAMSREGWEDGPTYEEVRTELNDYLANLRLKKDIERSMKEGGDAAE